MMLVFGSINADSVFQVPALPGRGDTVRSLGGGDVPGGRGAGGQGAGGQGAGGQGAGGQVAGGKGANAALAAARDGVPVTLVGMVGEDGLADAALRTLRHAGVRLHVRRTAEAGSGRAAVLVDPAGYTMVVVDAGANRIAQAAQVADAQLAQGGTLLAGLETAPAETAALMLRAKRAGMRVVLHFSPADVIETEALRAADVIIGNAGETAWLGEHLGTANNPASLRAALGGVAVVRMLGTQGAELFSDQGFLLMPALPVAMRDSTAAGDCFAGVFAGALSRGAGWREALRRAAVAAALSAARPRGPEGFPMAYETDAALRGTPWPTADQAEVED